MTLTGHSFLGSKRAPDTSQTFHVSNPATGEQLEPAFHSASKDDLVKAISLASSAFPAYSSISPETRAAFLRTIAENIDTLGSEITPRMMAETGLPEGRCQGERGRTVGQLRMFADLIEEGSWVDARIETAQPDRSPIPKPDLRSMRRPLGPVAVFCASNFPLAFSVAGGDTASALAAGCPVIVRAHAAHAGTAEIVASAIQAAVAECDMPEGTFSMIYDADIDLGTALIKNPGIKAVGFTGSRAGGRALMDAAAARPEPIPVFAEMSSVNPIFILPGAMAERGETIAQGLVGSVTLGAGQFCTCPGLVFAGVSDNFKTTLKNGFSEVAAATMLHAGIHQNYTKGLTKLQSQPGVETIEQVDSSKGNNAGATILKASASTFIANPALNEEIFGPSSLVIECGSKEDMLAGSNSTRRPAHRHRPRHRRRTRPSRRPSPNPRTKSRPSHYQQLPYRSRSQLLHGPRRPLPQPPRMVPAPPSEPEPSSATPARSAGKISPSQCFPTNSRFPTPATSPASSMAPLNASGVAKSKSLRPT